MPTAINPSFEPPHDDSDHEIWLLRAPAHLDVSKLLDGVTLELDAWPSSSSSSPASNEILSSFKSGDAEYSLVAGDSNECDDLRLLVPDGSGPDRGGSASLVPYRPFRRHVRLTSSRRGIGANDRAAGGDGAVQADPALAPARDAAPTPAPGRSGKNGSVDALRLAYAHVPQRGGLKRRWAMPGSGVGGESSSPTMPKRARAGAKVEDAVVVVGDGGSQRKKDAMVSDDEPRREKGAKSSNKKGKKEKKKKEKKSKKSPKK